MIPLTIDDLKKHLGPGLGLRKSKYMLEIPVPGTEGETINVLCRSTAFPERNIGTVAVFDKGRKYNMRSETSFPGTYNISILDDSNMALRWLFDGWLSLVDNTQPQGYPVSNSSYETQPEFSLGSFGEGTQTKYQADVNIWQLGNLGEKIYGYKLQNAFPTSLGIVELDDSDETTLSEFSVVFTYSETIPLKPVTGNIQTFSSTNLYGSNSPSSYGTTPYIPSNFIGEETTSNSLRDEMVNNVNLADVIRNVTNITKGNISTMIPNSQRNITNLIHTGGIKPSISVNTGLGNTIKIL